ncbi:uncharacterized protein VTP21DRAFT_11391 [Calcarisporiella thermophila]|uniref:uncharacterized protein n=1 Tax=Calcarisporiella thermophila TaxID=911321 RepID=UPI0037443927
MDDEEATLTGISHVIENSPSQKKYSRTNSPTKIDPDTSDEEPVSPATRRRRQQNKRRILSRSTTPTSTTPSAPIATSSSPSYSPQTSVKMLTNLPLPVSPTLPPTISLGQEEGMEYSDVEEEEVSGRVDSAGESKSTHESDGEPLAFLRRRDASRHNHSSFFTRDAFEKYSIYSIGRCFLREKQQSTLKDTPSTTKTNTLIPSDEKKAIKPSSLKTGDKLSERVASKTVTASRQKSVTSPSGSKQGTPIISHGDSPNKPGEVANPRLQRPSSRDATGAFPPNEPARAPASKTDLLGDLLGSMETEKKEAAPKANPSSSSGKMNQGQKPPISDNIPQVPQTVPTNTSLPPDLLVAAMASMDGPTDIADMALTPPSKSPQPSLLMQRYSSIPLEMHVKFLQLEMLMKTSPSLVPEHDQKFYLELRDQIAREQERYRAWVRQTTLPALAHLDPEIKGQLDTWFEQRGERVRLYPRQYEFFDTVSARSPVPKGRDPILSERRVVYCVGACPLYKAIEYPSVIPIDQAYWSDKRVIFSRKRAVAKEGSDIKSREATAQPLSGSKQDEAKEQSGSKQHHSNTPASHWRKKYISPVSQDPIAHRLAKEHGCHLVVSSGALTTIVRTQATLDCDWEIPVVVEPNQGSHNIVFIDKPLPKKRLTPREWNQKFFDVAFRSRSLDTELTISSEDWVLPSATAGTQAPTASKPESRTILSPVLLPEPMEVETGDEEIEDLVEGLEDEFLTYATWVFGELKLLVRCKMHGYTTVGTPPQIRPFGLKVKLDYQQPHGTEEVIANWERAHWWIHSYIRGGCELMIGHIDPITHRLLRVECRTLADIIPDGNWPLPHSRLLHYLLQRMSRLEVGNYIVAHVSREYSCTIYQARAGGRYDLWQGMDDDVAVDTERVGEGYIPGEWRGPPSQIRDTFPPIPEKGSGGSSGRNAGVVKDGKYWKRKREEQRRKKKQKQQQKQQQKQSQAGEESGGGGWQSWANLDDPTVGGWAQPVRMEDADDPWQGHGEITVPPPAVYDRSSKEKGAED